MNLIDVTMQTIPDDYFDVENGKKQQRGLAKDKDPFFSIVFSSVFEIYIFNISKI